MRRLERSGEATAGSRSVRTAAVTAAMAALLSASIGSAQVWEVGEKGLVLSGGPQDGGQFGQVTVSGDFNGDGYFDLAVGAPFWDSSSPAAEAHTADQASPLETRPTSRPCEPPT